LGGTTFGGSLSLFGRSLSFFGGCHLVACTFFLLGCGYLGDQTHHRAAGICKNSSHVSDGAKRCVSVWSRDWLPTKKWYLPKFNSYLPKNYTYRARREPHRDLPQLRPCQILAGLSGWQIARFWSVGGWQISRFVPSELFTSCDRQRI
jgi:hypothetical protein